MMMMTTKMVMMTIAGWQSNQWLVITLNTQTPDNIDENYIGDYHGHNDENDDDDDDDGDEDGWLAV